MNTRCYRCGWSFSLSREALEEAATASAGQKAHAIRCPRCRQVISIPMDQILRDLPAGWTPAAAASPAAGEAAATAPAEAAAPAEPETAASPAPEPAASNARSQRRHRHSGKTNIGDSAAVRAAKNSTHPN